MDPVVQLSFTRVTFPHKIRPVPQVIPAPPRLSSLGCFRCESPSSWRVDGAVAMRGQRSVGPWVNTTDCSLITNKDVAKSHNRRCEGFVPGSDKSPHTTCAVKFDFEDVSAQRWRVLVAFMSPCEEDKSFRLPSKRLFSIKNRQWSETHNANKEWG